MILVQGNKINLTSNPDDVAWSSLKPIGPLAKLVPTFVVNDNNF